MITGIHLLQNSRDPDATREFISRAISLGSVDAGRGWLIFALPPAELAVHPTEDETSAELYLMCDDVVKTLVEMERAGAKAVAPIREERWGKVTSLIIPGDVTIGLYEPLHPTALALSVEASAALRERR